MATVGDKGQSGLRSGAEGANGSGGAPNSAREGYLHYLSLACGRLLKLEPGLETRWATSRHGCLKKDDFEQPDDDAGSPTLHTTAPLF